MKNSLWLALFVFISFTLVQCRKSERNSEKINPAPANNATAMNTFNSVFKLIHAIAIEDSLVNGSQSSITAANINNCIDTLLYAQNTISYPNTVIIDYGTTNTQCSDGFSKRGKVNALVSGPYYSKGSSVTISFSGFHIDSLNISGSMSIINKGKNTNNNYVFGVVVTNATLSDGDTTDIIWNYSTNYEWLAGETSTTTTDDSFTISGSSNGRTSKGNFFDADITTPLVVDYSCRWVNEGLMEMDLGNILSLRTIDYGSGTCDDVATVTYQNTSYELKMIY